MTDTETKLLERVVVGPKPIHCTDKDGNRYVAQIGDTVFLTPHAAKTFARYVVDPRVAKAQEAAAEAEAEAALEEAPDKPTTGKKSAPKGGGSKKS